MNRTSDIKNIYRYAQDMNELLLVKNIFTQIFFLYIHFNPFGLEPRNLSILIFTLSVMLSIFYNNNKYLYLTLLGAIFSLSQTISLSVIILLYLLYLNFKFGNYLILVAKYCLMLIALIFLSSQLENNLIVLIAPPVYLFIIYREMILPNSIYRTFRIKYFFSVYLLILLPSAFIEFYTRKGILPLLSDFGSSFLLRAWQLEGFGRILAPLGVLLIFLGLFFKEKFSKSRKQDSSASL